MKCGSWNFSGKGQSSKFKYGHVRMDFLCETYQLTVLSDRTQVTPLSLRHHKGPIIITKKPSDRGPPWPKLEWKMLLRTWIPRISWAGGVLEYQRSDS